MRTASAILVSDLHLMDRTPACRPKEGEFVEAMANKLEWLGALQAQNGNCPILCGGDLLDQARPSCFLLYWAISMLPPNFITVAGNHELPSHRLDKLSASGLGVLEACECVKVQGHTRTPLQTANATVQVDVYGASYGEQLPRPRRKATRRIAITHRMTWVTLPYPGCAAPDAKALLRANPAYDLILTGDNHSAFVYTDPDGRKVVNPGSMMRLSADQASFRPRAYLYFAEDNSVKPAYFPITTGVISREHIRKQQKQDKAVATFIERIKKTKGLTLDFRKNVRTFIDKEKPSAGVEAAIWEALK